MNLSNDVNEQAEIRCTAFDGFRRIAAGKFMTVAASVKRYADRNPDSSILIFDDVTSRIIDVDLRGTLDDVLDRVNRQNVLAPVTARLIEPLRPSQAAAGRPKLGVVAREVTLLPRHWEWLNRQPGGASVALRKLVEEARRMNSGKDNVRQAQETSYRFMSAIAGDLPGFEEALRALFAGDSPKFGVIIAAWPADVREHALKLASNAFTV